MLQQHGVARAAAIDPPDVERAEEQVHELRVAADVVRGVRLNLLACADTRTDRRVSDRPRSVAPRRALAPHDAVEVQLRLLRDILRDIRTGDEGGIPVLPERAVVREEVVDELRRRPDAAAHAARRRRRRERVERPPEEPEGLPGDRVRIRPAARRRPLPSVLGADAAVPPHVLLEAEAVLEVHEAPDLRGGAGGRGRGQRRFD